MDRLKKFKVSIVNGEAHCAKTTRIGKCSVCGNRFKSHSHFDAICDLCWADNEMRPYVIFGGNKGLVS